MSDNLKSIDEMLYEMVEPYELLQQAEEALQELEHAFNAEVAPIRSIKNDADKLLDDFTDKLSAFIAEHAEATGEKTLSEFTVQGRKVLAPGQEEEIEKWAREKHVEWLVLPKASSELGGMLLEYLRYTEPHLLEVNMAQAKREAIKEGTFRTFIQYTRISRDKILQRLNFISGQIAFNKRQQGK